MRITADGERDARIFDKATSYDSSLSFGVLKEAQPLADPQALLDAGRRVIRFHLSSEVTDELNDYRIGAQNHGFQNTL